MKSCTFKVRPTLRLTIYLLGGRTVSGEYSRREAATRLRFARHKEGFRAYKKEML